MPDQNILLPLCRDADDLAAKVSKSIRDNSPEWRQSLADYAAGAVESSGDSSRDPSTPPIPPTCGINGWPDASPSTADYAPYGGIRRDQTTSPPDVEWMRRQVSDHDACQAKLAADKATRLTRDYSHLSGRDHDKPAADLPDPLIWRKRLEAAEKRIAHLESALQRFSAVLKTSFSKLEEDCQYNLKMVDLWVEFGLNGSSDQGQAKTNQGSQVAARPCADLDLR